MIQPSLKNIILLCLNCKRMSIINWQNVDNSMHIFDDTYGEFLCPICKTKHAVYTQEKIENLKQGLVQ